MISHGKNHQVLFYPIPSTLKYSGYSKIIYLTLIEGKAITRYFNLHWIVTCHLPKKREKNS
jgi:hypothetical protein